MAVSLWFLVSHSLAAVAQVVLLGASGLLLQRAGILQPAIIKGLNKVAVTCFLPGLVFTKIGSAVDLDSLAAWWLLLANIVLDILLGLSLGWVAALACGTPQHLRRMMMGMCVFANLATIPFVLMGSLCKNTNGPFGYDCEDRASAMISLGANLILLNLAAKIFLLSHLL